MEEKHVVFVLFLLVWSEVIAQSKSWKVGATFLLFAMGKNELKVVSVHRPIKNNLVDPSQAKQLLSCYWISSQAS